MKKLKVLSYNIHKGFSGVIRKYTLHRIREVIREIHPDIIFLQEVQGSHVRRGKRIGRWPDISQFEFLAEELWPHFSYGKNAVYPEGHHGNAILSKFPILSWENHDISTNRYDRRGILHAVIKLPGKPDPLHAVCLHLGLFEESRRRQLMALTDRIRSMVPAKGSVIVAGDFNDWRISANLHRVKGLKLDEAFLCSRGHYAKTFPAFLPFLRLDRVYFRDLEVVRTKCLSSPPWSSLSDHAALEVEFAIKNGQNRLDA